MPSSLCCTDATPGAPLRTVTLSTRLLRLIFGLWTAWMLLVACIPERSGPVAWDYTSWLINYEGGFVRRGLLGQLLLELWRVWPYDLGVMFHVLYFSGLLLLTALMVRLFKVQGWSPVVLTCLGVLGHGFLNKIYPARDFWLLLLAYGCFIGFRAWWCAPRQNARGVTPSRGGGLGAATAFYLCGVGALFLHEAAIFFTLAPVAVAGWCVERSRGRSPLGAAGIMALVTLPMTAVTLLHMAFHGDPAMARAIWLSWQEPLLALGSPELISPEPVASVEAIGWTSRFAASLHFHMNFLRPLSISSPWWPSWPFWFIAIAMQYYLVTRMNVMDLHLWPLRRFSATRLGSILTIQFVAMLPLFLVLSCDTPRLYSYWTLSSLMAFATLGRHIRLRPVTALNSRLQRFISSLPLLERRSVSYAVFILLPLSRWGGGPAIKQFYLLWAAIYDLPRWIDRFIL